MFYLNKIKKPNINKIFLIVVGFYSLFTFFNILKRIYVGNNFYSTANWFNFILENYLIKYFLVLIFTYIIIYSCRAMLHRKISWFKTTCIHIIFASLLGVFLFLSFALFQNTLIPNFRFTFNAFTNYYINSIDSNFLIYFSIVGVFYTLYHIEKLKFSDKKNKKLNDNLAQSKISILKAQMQPHFLFNGLNTISSLMNNDVLLAQNTAEDLGDYLRETLKIKDKNLIPVHEEIILTNKYIHILKARFDKQLVIDLNYEDNVKNCLIPSMFLQPIIENLIKKAFPSNSAPLKISIDISKKSKTLLILIKNTGKIIKTNYFNNNDIELINLKERLQLLYPNNFSFKNIKSKQLVITSIKIPCDPIFEID